jgi:predicted metalloprotease with PDZ domain
MFRLVTIVHDAKHGLGIDLDTEEDEFGMAAYIAEVMPDGAAATSGACAGDQIISCNGILYGARLCIMDSSTNPGFCQPCNDILYDALSRC